ncbi:MAG: hypothetical protein AB1295_01055 [Candidatus Micrarchaeota archaeon]
MLLLINSLQKATPLEMQNLLLYASIIGVFFTLINANLFFPQFSVIDSWYTQKDGIQIEVQKLEFIPQQLPTVIPVQIRFGSSYLFSNSDYYKFLYGPYISNLSACEGHYLKLWSPQTSSNPEKTFAFIAISNDSKLLNISKEELMYCEKCLIETGVASEFTKENNTLRVNPNPERSLSAG